MLKSILRLFSNPKAQQTSLGIEPVKDDQARPIEEFFQEELEGCPYIRPEFKHRVLDHLLHKINLTKTDNILSTDEKKALGLNHRLAITKELVEVLTSEGIALANPKSLLDEIYNKSTITKARIDGFQKARKLGVMKFQLLPSGDGSECSWCEINSKKELGIDVLEQMKLHCRCTPYSKCSIIPKINFQES